jgi:cytochrome c-type biogenesis protein CcmH/NrfG
MKQPLPQSTTKVIALFPRNIRSITEFSFTQAQSHNIKVILVSVVSVFLLGLIFLQAVTIWYNVREREVFAQERAQMQKQVQYWQQVADKYKGYRDVYYRIATIQYKLGNVSAAQNAIKKALELDPNFPEGQVLGAKVGL